LNEHKATEREMEAMKASGHRNDRLDTSAFAIAVVPLVLAALPSIFHAVLGAYYLWTIDPDYAYLMNALNIDLWRSPVFVYHPGTPVQELGALVIAAVWAVSTIFRHMPSLEVSVVTNPELFLRTINIVLSLLIALAAFVFGRRLHQASRNLAVALGGQFSLLLSPQIVMATTGVAPEAMIVFSTLVLMTLLIAVVFSTPGTESSAWDGAWIGGALGLSLAVKISTLPLLLSIFLIRGAKARMITVCAAFLSFVLLTLPIISQFPGMITYWIALATHRGHYGEGEFGVPGIADLIDNARALASIAPEFFIGAIVYALLAVATARPRGSAAHSSVTRLLGIAAAIAALQICLAVKQNQDRRYLLPAIVFGCLANAGVIHLFISSPRWLRFPSRAVIAAVLVGGLWYSASAMRDWALAISAYSRSGLELEQRLNGVGCTIVPYYNASLIEYGLAFGSGSEYSSVIHNKTLNSLYPDFLSYNVWEDRFFDFSSGKVEKNEGLRRLSASRCVYFYGNSVGGDVPMTTYVSAGLLKPVMQSDSLRVYELQRTATGEYLLEMPTSTH
jgi:hypothetical protein